MQQLFLLNAPVLSRHLNLSHSHLFYSSHVYFGERTVHSYVPTLAREVLDNAPEINIKGVAVGDPCTDNKAQADSMDMVWYGHKNGFIPDELFDTLWNKCGGRDPHPLTNGRWGAAAAGAKLSSSRRLEGLGANPSRECVLAERQYLASTSRGFSQGWSYQGFSRGLRVAWWR